MIAEHFLKLGKETVTQAQAEKTKIKDKQNIKSSKGKVTNNIKRNSYKAIS